MFLLFLTLAGSLAGASISPVAEPKIVKDEGNFHLDIGKPVQEALKKFDPYFEAWNETDFIPAVRQSYKATANQTLAGIVGDFNNDKIKDVALIGRNRTNNLLLAAVSEGEGYKVVEIDRSPLIDPRKEWIEGPKGKEPGLWVFLRHQKPGYVSSHYENGSLQLKADAFTEDYFEKAAVLYYFKDGKFERYTTGD